MLLRAVRYVGRHRRLAVLAYGSLLLATAAQLMVPQLVRIIIDSFVSGVQGTSGQSAAVQTLIGAMIAIVVFSLIRAVFAYGQQYNAERISQNIAFDFRNELFAKIQRLSFSYLDRTQTGQLMIRATDDVEPVKRFHVGVQGVGTDSAIPRYGEACRIPVGNQIGRRFHEEVL